MLAESYQPRGTDVNEAPDPYDGLMRAIGTLVNLALRSAMVAILLEARRLPDELVSDLPLLFLSAPLQ